MTNAYLAVDLGAESGRVIACALAGGRMDLAEVHRFTHEPIWLPTGLHWDITGIWREIVRGLREAAHWCEANGAKAVPVGVDTWGVDWALLDGAGELVGLPHAYRDPRNQGAYEQVRERLGDSRIYQTTGIQFMPLNTLYSLYAHHLADAGALCSADKLLFIPDLLHYWLSGKILCEATIASTSQMVDCDTGDWAREMLAELGLPTHFLPPISPAGSRVGPLRADLSRHVLLPEGVAVISPAAHDTASAVAAVPATGDTDWCYLSSGTWSLLGAELREPCRSAAAEAASFTNERGIDGTFRFLKNIPGLWLVQECRRALSLRGEEYDYPALMRLAGEGEALGVLVDPSLGGFQTHANILEEIAAYARRTGQKIADSPGAYVRCCLESLALAYREKLLTMESILAKRFDTIHIVGGGGKNTLLCQMTADATGRKVVVGPYEATAMGNALVQAMAMGEVRDLGDLRRIVANSTQLVTYEPRDAATWDEAYGRYQALIASG